MKNKVFVIGFNKTGTTSMTEALTKLGFKFCPEYVVYNGSLNYFQDQISKKYDSLFKLVINMMRLKIGLGITLIFIKNLISTHQIQSSY